MDQRDEDAMQERMAMLTGVETGRPPRRRLVRRIVFARRNARRRARGGLPAPLLQELLGLLELASPTGSVPRG
jgi:hypothetical protein